MSFFFSDMFGGGGMPGGGMPGGHGHPHGHDSDEDEGASDTNRFYEILGVDKSVSEQDLKKAYRKKAREVHPDRHADEREKYHEKFQEVQTAYETLSDPHKKQLYDKYGEKGLKRGGGGGGDMGDILSQFFGGGDPRASGGRGGRGGDYGRKQSPAIKKVIDVTLEDLYLGSTKKIKITRKVAAGDSAECARCHGSGNVTVTQRMGPMIVQQRAKCSQCGGQGYQLKAEEAEVELHIPMGGRHAETVTVQGEGNKYPNQEPGDIVFQMRQGKHDVFKRQGADLGMTHTLTLRQALCGYKIKVEHVSGRTLVISSRDGEIVQPGQLKQVYSYGMPIRFQPHTKGHLYIVMEIKLPLANSLNNQALQAFRRILPDIERDDQDFDMEEKVNDNKKNNSNDKPKRKPKTNKNNGNEGEDDDGEDDEEEEEEPEHYTEEVEAHDVDDNPKATPASARSSYDEDEQDQNVQCRHM